MKYITTNTNDKTYKADYNTNNFTEQELIKIAAEWQAEDNDGTEYFLEEEKEIKYKLWGKYIDLELVFDSEEEAKAKMQEWLESDKQEFVESNENDYSIDEIEI